MPATRHVSGNADQRQTFIIPFTYQRPCHWYWPCSRSSRYIRAWSVAASN